MKYNTVVTMVGAVVFMKGDGSLKTCTSELHRHSGEYHLFVLVCVSSPYGLHIFSSNLYGLYVVFPALAFTLLYIILILFKQQRSRKSVTVTTTK